MSITRTVEIQVEEILDLISCAEDYGHTNSVCIFSLFKWAGPISDEDIEAYITNVLKDPQYGEEDAEDIRERLTEMRDKYQPKEPNHE
jgi:hypothetical protein